MSPADTARSESRLPIAIVGLGQIGGSVARALWRMRDDEAVCIALGWNGHVVAVDPDRTALDFALKNGWVSGVFAACAELPALSGAVVSAPLEATTSVLAALAARGGEFVVTDVGSVKQSTLATGQALLGTRYVSSHPMAGTAQSGLVASRADLFDGARVLRCTLGASQRAVDWTAALWSAVGGRVVDTTPECHDGGCMAVSHLPHVVSFSLMLAVAEMAEIAERESGANWSDWAGPSLRDMTRVSASDPKMWREVLLANRAHLLQGLAQYRAALEKFERAISASDGAELEHLLSDARTQRVGWFGG